MPRPFEVDRQYLAGHLDEMVSATFADLRSQFLVLPRGPGFVEYAQFQDAYEVLKRHSGGFRTMTRPVVWSALRESALVFTVLRSILGLSAPEWAALLRSEGGADVPQGFARQVDLRCRSEPRLFERMTSGRAVLAFERVDALVSVAVRHLARGASDTAPDEIHRLDKVDTMEGLISLRHAADQHVPYAMLLYERLLGRPFAGHRDAVSELVGDVMERAVEEHLRLAGISYRKTGRAERVPTFAQAPDFFVPDEFNPTVVIEAKIAEDDGTARDKVTRILRLATLSEERGRDGRSTFEVVACIDGRGFGVRRADMRQLIERTGGRVFTRATLDRLVQHTRLREYSSLVPPDAPTHMG